MIACEVITYAVLKQTCADSGVGYVCRYFCQTDFIAPKESGVKDYIGMFVDTAGLGIETLTEKYKAAGDDYSYIMAEALADRLAEALAEKVHEMVRKDIWGYSPDENFSTDDLLKVKYQVCCRWLWSPESTPNP
jgi:cobalamin-dependent methionine synthase I